MSETDELFIEMSATKILETVKKNKERFQKSYKLALKAFDKLAQAYQKKYDEWRAKSGVISKQPQPPPKPEDKTKDYDLYIAMLTEHIEYWKGGDNDTDIKLSETLFKRLIMDRWDWTYRHHDTLMFYASKAGGAGSELASMAVKYAE